MKDSFLKNDIATHQLLCKRFFFSLVFFFLWYVSMW